jgi:hypothetical protein
MPAAFASRHKFRFCREYWRHAVVSLRRAQFKPLDGIAQMSQDQLVGHVRDLSFQVLHAVNAGPQDFLKIRTRVLSDIAGISRTFTLYEN